MKRMIALLLSTILCLGLMSGDFADEASAFRSLAEEDDSFNRVMTDKRAGRTVTVTPDQKASKKNVMGSIPYQEIPFTLDYN